MDGDDKLYLGYSDIHRTVKQLSVELGRSGYEPEVMVAIGTGGFIPARILKTFTGLPILTVGIRYYTEENKPLPRPRTIQWIDEVEKKLAGKRVLLVDEVDDSRVTLSYCLRELLRHEPEEIGVMVLHNKRKTKRDVLPPQVRHYFVGREVADIWISYPWDAQDIDEHEALAAAASGS